MPEVRGAGGDQPVPSAYAVPDEEFRSGARKENTIAVWDPGRAGQLILRGAGVKARVYVTFKPSVLDPQGQTICHALNSLGHSGIEDVRQGKFFEITMQPGEDLDAIARDVLSNPVIEDYRIEMLD